MVENGCNPKIDGGWWTSRPVVMCYRITDRISSCGHENASRHCGNDAFKVHLEEADQHYQFTILQLLPCSHDDHYRLGKSNRLPFCPARVFASVSADLDNSTGNVAIGGGTEECASVGVLIAIEQNDGW